jgi:phage gpG-like protein
VARDDDGDTTVNVKGLDQLLKALKVDRLPVARIGILGGGAVRKGAGPSNAEVGAVHEYGSPARGIPQRSFLRIPISENLDKRMVNIGAADQDALTQVIKTGSLLPWLTKVAALAEQIVFDAFDTGGFGKWPAWKSKAYTNNTGMLLVDTQQLRNSITTEVKG